MVFITVSRLATTSWSRGSSYIWTISSNKGIRPRMRFYKESSRREIEARVRCESLRGRRVDHLRRVDDVGGPNP